MVENIDSIVKIIEDYLNALKRENIFVEKAYLFGSYAKGTATVDSDIDLAVISKDFVGNRFNDRMKIAPLRWNVDLRLEPVPYRPEDFKYPDPLAIDILEHGIEIKL